MKIRNFGTFGNDRYINGSYLSTGNDVLPLENQGEHYGLKGDDTFDFGTIIFPSLPPQLAYTGTYFTVGGSGADTYEAARGNSLIIYDGSRSAGDTLLTSELGSSLEDFSLSIIDNRHLYISSKNFYSDSSYDFRSYALILDWQSPLSRIETIQVADQNFSYTEYSERLLQAIQNPEEASLNYLGDFSWEQAFQNEMIITDQFSPETIDLKINSIKATAQQLELLPHPPSPQDLNGDFKTDILLHDAEIQQSAIAYMDNDRMIAIAPLWIGWKAFMASDFNGDRNADIVIHHGDESKSSILYMDDSGNIQDSKSIASWKEWNIIGSGNFLLNSSIVFLPDTILGSKGEVLIHNPTESWYGLWYMGGDDGTEIFRSQGIAMWENWEIKTSGDFNQDGQLDLVAQHTTEDWTGIFYLDHSHGSDRFIADSQGVAGWEDWHVMGAADLDNDGQTDLLIQHKSEDWKGVLYMQGDQVVGSSGLASLDGWQTIG